MDDDVPGVIGSLSRAMNAHDPVALAACFATGYRNETPAHPSRGFIGRAQVLANWSQILAAVPDLSAVLVRWGTGAPREPETVWTEWDWSGTRRDGRAMRMRGVTVFGTGPKASDGDAMPEIIEWARFYMEDVDTEEIGVGTAVRRSGGSAP